MALLLPSGPDWAYCTHNLPTDIAASSLGASYSAGASNADGTAVALFSAALTHDVEYLRLGFTMTTSSSQINDVLSTILIDPAGGTSWASFIPFLATGPLGPISVSTTAPNGHTYWYDFPIFIKSGSALGVYGRTAHSGTIPMRCTAIAYGGNANPASWWCGQGVEAIAVNSAASAGTAHTAGSSASFSSWTNLGSTLSHPCGALQWGATGEGDSINTTNNYQFEFGVGGVRIGAPLFRHINTGEIGFALPTGPIFKRLASGTQLQVRGAADGASPQAIGVAAYAVY